jgi:branched-chain amino acid transport system substrate-binding protein
MPNLARRSAIYAAIVSLLITAITGCSPMPNTIKIGVAQPLSGGLAALGKDLANGVQLAVDELNKQGFQVDGKKVTFETIVVDDKSDPEEGKKVAQQLVDAGVVAVMGHLNSGVSIAAAPIYAEKGIAQLALSTSPKFTALGFPTTLRLVGNDDLQARALGVFASQQLTENKFAVIDDGTLYGKGLADAVAKQLEGKKTLALRQGFDNKTKDFAALADKIKADKIEVLVTVLNPFQVVALIEALTKIDYARQVTILGSNALKTSDMAKQSGNVGKLLATSSVLEAGEFTGGRAFLDAYQATFKIPPNYGSHYTYDATHILASTIKRIKTVDPARITEALRKSDVYAPVTNSMRWTPTGEQRYGMVSVYTVNGDRWESIMRSDKW